MLDFDKLNQELKEDTRIDELNLLQKQLMLPGIKHKWVARLIDQKRTLNSLEQKKKNLKVTILSTLEDQKAIPPGIPKASLDKKIESSDSIQKLNQDIEDTKLAVEYLEKVEQVLKSMTYDIKNIIEINKLETT